MDGYEYPPPTQIIRQGVLNEPSSSAIPCLMLTKNPDKRLTLKQREFVANLATTKNATEAARRTYTTSSGMSASAIAYENLCRANIQKALRTIMDDDRMGLEHIVGKLYEEYERAKFPRDRITALMGIGKFRGFEKTHVTHEGLPLTINVLSHAETKHFVNERTSEKSNDGREEMPHPQRPDVQGP